LLQKRKNWIKVVSIQLTANSLFLPAHRMQRRITDESGPLALKETRPWNSIDPEAADLQTKWHAQALSIKL